MKRFLGIIFLFVACLTIVGCSANNGNAKMELATQKLSSSLDKLIIATKNISVVDNQNIDLSNDLGYYLDANRTGENVPLLDVPTPNKINKPNRYDLCGKRFYFVSKEAEEKYGNLYELSVACKNMSDELNGKKNELIDGCIASKTLLNEIRQANIATSDLEIKTLNSYNEAINSCIEKISSKMNCSQCVKNIVNKKSNLLSNSTSMEVDFLRLASDLDSGCISCEHSIICVNELNKYLQNKLGIESTEDNAYLYNYRHHFIRARDNVVPAPIEPFYNENGELEKGRITDKKELEIDDEIENGEIEETFNNDVAEENKTKAVNPPDFNYDENIEPKGVKNLPNIVDGPKDADGENNGNKVENRKYIIPNHRIIKRHHKDEVYEKNIRPYRRENYVRSQVK